MMAILESAKLQNGSHLDRIHSDVKFHGKEITPTIFSMLLSSLQTRLKKVNFGSRVFVTINAVHARAQVLSPYIIGQLSDQNGVSF